MNYVILNGINSNTIDGLLIQELPPISKPRIRTEVEEIDGRNGDILTRLGYAAYDKQMKIGLYGNFDINEVIAFFNSYGEITFSNEPDKYYKYEIVEQIDFERLVRFREATVTFHMQPFKYSNTEEMLTFNTEGLSEIEVTNSGNCISKPIITLFGSGTINLSLNGNQLFVIDLTNDNQITIDTNTMEAYLDGILKNRLVTGNYDNFALVECNNTLSWSGDITQIDIENYSRWI